MKIKYSCYKYAPETAAASVNGIKLDLNNTNIGYLIATGRTAEAEKELKKLYRRTIKAPTNYIYAFFAKDSKQFYYIAWLNFSAADTIERRLHCYKELKHHLQRNPIEIRTEAGHITPTGASAPEVKTITIPIDFRKCKKIKLI